MSHLSTTPIVIRKMAELTRETVPAVVKQISPFINAMTAEYQKQQAGQKDPYQAMQDTAGQGPPFKGIGGPPMTSFTTLSHVLSAKSFFDINLSVFWKNKTRHEMSPGTTEAQLFIRWGQLVTNDSFIPFQMLDQTLSSQASWGLSWWSPDQRTQLPSSGSQSQAQQDFFTLSKVLSLAPEWYSYGLVRINIDLNQLPPAKNGVARPSTYDGSTSPLWVQHPATQPARTGGGALETLNATELFLSDLSKSSPGVKFPQCQAYIIPATLTAALSNSPSVNDYSQDPTLVSKDPILGPEQKQIVAEVDQSRQTANTNFLTPPVTPAQIQNLIKTFSLQAPSHETMKTTEDWKRQMTNAAQRGLVQHPGQRFPHEQFQEILERKPETEANLIAAASELLKESNDPNVLNLVSSLQPKTRHSEYFCSILNCLENPKPSLKKAGISAKTIETQMHQRITEHEIAHDAKLAPRAHKILKDQKRYDLLLSMLCQHDPQDQKLSVLKDAVAHHGSGFDLNLAAHLGHHFGPNDPAVAAELKKLGQDHLDAFNAAQL